MRGILVAGLILALAFSIAETRTSTAAPPELTLVALTDQTGTVDIVVSTNAGLQTHTVPANGGTTITPGTGVATLTQRVEPGRVVTSINCTGTTTVQTDLAQREVTIVLQEDEVATCTWVNSPPTTSFQSPPQATPTAPATPTSTPFVATATPVSEVAGVQTTPSSAPINLLATPQNASNVNSLAPNSPAPSGQIAPSPTVPAGTGLVSEVLGTQITPPSTGSAGLK